MSEPVNTAVVNVLDSGFVRLVRPSGGDIDVVRAARVSFNADWRAGEDEHSDERLIRYLMKNHHTSPFEHVVFTFEVKAPIFIVRQWHRHRTWSYSEISARYAELDEGFYLPDAAVIGMQSKDNKQARDVLDIEQPYANIARTQIKAHCDYAFGVYRNLLNNGIPRELARSVLPVAAYTRMFATVDLHNLMGFLRLRLHSHSQWEIRQYAEAIVKLVEPIVPVTMAAFLDSMKVTETVNG